MRIEGPPYVVDLARPEGAQRQRTPAEAVQGGEPPGRPRSFDRIEISPAVRELQRLKRDLDALPEVRLDRVALAKQNLRQGGRVEPAALAQRMMEAFGTR